MKRGASPCPLICLLGLVWCGGMACMAASARCNQRSALRRMAAAEVIVAGQQALSGAIAGDGMLESVATVAASGLFWVVWRITLR
jgi:hypothetical protein